MAPEPWCISRSTGSCSRGAACAASSSSSRGDHPGLLADELQAGLCRILVVSADPGGGDPRRLIGGRPHGEPLLAQEARDAQSVEPLFPRRGSVLARPFAVAY